MALERIKEVCGQAAYIPGDNIDTDRIIPARFMKCVTFDGLGEYAFYDVLHDHNGNIVDHPLNSFPNAKILITGSNFGCGSSREHAPQALYHRGIRAVVAESFAEIFFGNCITLGIICVSSPQSKVLGDLWQKNPELAIQISLEDLTIKLGDEQEFTCEIPETSRQSLMQGEWDPIARLLDTKDHIMLLEQRRPSFIRQNSISPV